MHSDDEIFEQLKSVLVELFEIEPAKVVPAARLYQDLDIDSIDAIDLVLTLKERTGRKIEAEAFKHARTVGDLVAALKDLLATPADGSPPAAAA